MMVNEASPPLPEPVVISRHLPTGVAIYGYTAEQMRAAITAECERWTEAVMAELDGNGQAQAIVAYATRA